MYVSLYSPDNRYGNIDFRNRLYHDTLPPAISGQNSYWTWGMHGCDQNLVIAIIPDTAAEIGTKYESVAILGHNSNTYSMPFEQRNIYLLRGRMSSASFNWADERFYY
jgi:hypothetical protein